MHPASRSCSLLLSTTQTPKLLDSSGQHVSSSMGPAGARAGRGSGAAEAVGESSGELAVPALHPPSPAGVCSASGGRGAPGGEGAAALVSVCCGGQRGLRNAHPV